MIVIAHHTLEDLLVHQRADRYFGRARPAARSGRLKTVRAGTK
jgi:hypothetical protein